MKHSSFSPEETLLVGGSLFPDAAAAANVSSRSVFNPTVRKSGKAKVRTAA